MIKLDNSVRKGTIQYGLLFVIWLVFVFLFDFIFLRLLPLPLAKMFSEGRYIGCMNVDPQFFIAGYFLLPLFTGYIFYRVREMSLVTIGFLSVAPLYLRVIMELIFFKLYGSETTLLLPFMLINYDQHFLFVLLSIRLILIALFLFFMGYFYASAMRGERRKTVNLKEIGM